MSTMPPPSFASVSPDLPTPPAASSSTNRHSLAHLLFSLLQLGSILVLALSLLAPVPFDLHWSVLRINVISSPRPLANSSSGILIPPASGVVSVPLPNSATALSSTATPISTSTAGPPNATKELAVPAREPNASSDPPGASETAPTTSDKPARRRKRRSTSHHLAAPRMA
ncbi:uncharacterized protein PFL1_05715 [Pseudozyma flocculosa PF-1]|uniref:Uncharacterized protein n=2 Tax=Pseudozyma flocculosa TaxID=84751 RepID=A0A5C3FBR5_9BASI|nr:uncharacterized protein PFL1_05715 [Pseudozyma flocculosa PF-1]EPQ26736.1 hypothetical protein PFL1_05715 [Pseudozyma flocculosa PF-1]SPO40941.1 uncharacterized protein PSFLO_06423 [Pseudozyma flocculosa]